MKKAVIFDAARRAALETFLPDAAAKVTAAGDAVRASFPALTWNTLFVWVLCCEKAAADDLCRQVLEDAASAAGLSNCFFRASRYRNTHSAISARMGGTFTMNSVAPVPSALPIRPTGHRSSIYPGG